MGGGVGGGGWWRRQRRRAICGGWLWWGRMDPKTSVAYSKTDQIARRVRVNGETDEEEGGKRRHAIWAVGSDGSRLLPNRPPQNQESSKFD